MFIHMYDKNHSNVVFCMLNVFLGVKPFGLEMFLNLIVYI